MSRSGSRSRSPWARRRDITHQASAAAPSSSAFEGPPRLGLVCTCVSAPVDIERFRCISCWNTHAVTCQGFTLFLGTWHEEFQSYRIVQKRICSCCAAEITCLEPISATIFRELHCNSVLSATQSNALETYSESSASEHDVNGDAL